MKSDLNRLRRAFPSWPSELDGAKYEANWAEMAQQFYCAACVLHDEMRIVRDRMHSGESLQMTVDILKRIGTSRPAIFCMAFAIELAAKAAIVCKTQGAGIEHGKKLPFADHDVEKLCNKLPGLALSSTDRDCLKQVKEIIMNGKYPTGIKPSDDKISFSAPSFENFMSVALPIYEKLMNFATAAQTVAPGDVA